MPDRLLWHRPSSDSAYRGAFLLARIFREPRYVQATWRGYVISRSPPPGGDYVTVLPPAAGIRSPDSACGVRRSV